MATHTIGRANIEPAPQPAHRNIAQKISQIIRHPGRSFRGYFGYADGRLWAPERDVEDPFMRRFALALGKTARVLHRLHKEEPSMAERMYGFSGSNFDAAVYRGVARRVDLAVCSNARQKLTNALFEDSLSGGTATHPHNRRTRVAENPRIAQLSEARQTELLYTAQYILEIMADPAYGINVDLNDDDTRAAVGHRLHDRKLRANDAEPGFLPVEQRVSFEQLPSTTQDAEIRQVQIAQNMFRTGHPGLQGALERAVAEGNYVNRYGNLLH